MNRAKLARVYGWTHSDICELDAEAYKMYLEAVKALEAQEMLNEIKVTSFPNLTKKARKSVFDSLLKLAFPVKPKAKKLSMDEFAEHLRGLTNGQS